MKYLCEIFYQLYVVCIHSEIVSFHTQKMKNGSENFYLRYFGTMILYHKKSPILADVENKVF